MLHHDFTTIFEVAGNTTEVEVSGMRKCGHNAVRHGTIDHRRASHPPIVSGGATAATAAALVTQVANLMPAPPAALTHDDRAWSAFEALLDQAANGLAAAIGPEGRPALEAVTSSPLAAGPVSLLLVERTLGQLAKIAY